MKSVKQVVTGIEEKRGKGEIGSESRKWIMDIRDMDRGKQQNQKQRQQQNASH